MCQTPYYMPNAFAYIYDKYKLYLLHIYIISTEYLHFIKEIYASHMSYEHVIYTRPIFITLDRPSTIYMVMHLDRLALNLRGAI